MSGGAETYGKVGQRSGPWNQQRGGGVDIDKNTFRGQFELEVRVKKCLGGCINFSRETESIALSLISISISDSIVMRHSRMGVGSEKCIARRFLCCEKHHRVHLHKPR